VAQSTVDCGGSEQGSWNTAFVDLLHLSIVLYGLVNELRVPR
jgi:hypothetical protein